MSRKKTSKFYTEGKGPDRTVHPLSNPTGINVKGKHSGATPVMEQRIAERGSQRDSATKLVIDNDYQLYRRKHFQFLRLQELVHQDKYNKEKSLGMFKLLTDDVGRANRIGIEDRRKADRELREEFEDGDWKEEAKSLHPDRYKRVFQGWHTVDFTIANTPKDKELAVKRVEQKTPNIKAIRIRSAGKRFTRNSYHIQVQYKKGGRKTSIGPATEQKNPSILSRVKASFRGTKQTSVTYGTVEEAKRMAAGVNKDGIYIATRNGKTVHYKKPNKPNPSKKESSGRRQRKTLEDYKIIFHYSKGRRETVKTAALDSDDALNVALKTRKKKGLKPLKIEVVDGLGALLGSVVGHAAGGIHSAISSFRTAHAKGSRERAEMKAIRDESQAEKEAWVEEKSKQMLDRAKAGDRTAQIWCDKHGIAWEKV